MSRFTRLRRGVAIVSASALTVGALAVASMTFAQAEPAEVDDATLTWGLSGYSQVGVFGAWTYNDLEGNVEHLVGSVSGGDQDEYLVEPFPATSFPANLAGETPNAIKFTAGEGTVDPATGATELSWDGAYTINAYPPQFNAPDEIYSDPVLSLDGSGDGELTMDFTLGGGVDLEGNPVDPENLGRVTLLTFSDGSVDGMDDTGYRVTPDFAGVTNGLSGQATNCTSPDVWGSWPTEFIDAIADTAVVSHFYTTGCGGAQNHKGALPVDIGYTIPDEPEPTTGSIEGTITDAESDDGIDGATVSLDDEAESEATTGADGTFTLEDVDEGTYEATVSADGYEDGTTEVEVEAGETATLNLALTPEDDEVPSGPAEIELSQTTFSTEGDHTVTVTGTGFTTTGNMGTRPPTGVRPAGVYVVFGDFADEWRPSQTTGGRTLNYGQRWPLPPETYDHASVAFPNAQYVRMEADGSFELDLPISYRAPVNDNFGIYTYAGGGAVNADEELYEPITFVEDEDPEYGSVSGTITDADTDDGISGATVTIDGEDATTAGDGTYEITDLDAGDYSVAVTADGYEDGSGNVTVEEGETATFDLALTPEVEEVPEPGSVEGTITDADTGNGINGADVTIDGTTVSTGANGTYTHPELDAGGYSVTVTADGYEDGSGNVTVEEGETATFDLALTPEGDEVPEPETGSVEGTITDADTGNGINGADVTIDGTTVSTGANGTYTHPELDAGGYSVTVTATGYEDGSGNVTVEEGETATFDLALTPEGDEVPEPETGSVEGTITDADTSDGISGATVTIDGEDATTGTDGSYELTDLGVGDYTATVTADGYEDGSGNVTVEADATATFSLALTPEDDDDGNGGDGGDNGDGGDVGTVGACDPGGAIDPDPSELNDDNRGDVSVPDSASPGDTIQVTVGEDRAGTSVDVCLFSTPAFLGTHVVGEDGTVQVTIPADVELGDHQVAVYNANGDLIGWDDIQIVADSGATVPAGDTGDGTGAGQDLPDTGGSSLILLIGAVVLLVTGGALLIARRFTGKGAA